MESGQLKELWDSESKKYTQFPPVTSDTWPMPKSFLPRLGARVVDVGCGAGRFFPLFSTLSNDLHGVDLSPKMVEAASQFARCQVGDVMELPLEDRDFDYVFSYLVISHVPDPQKALSELSRICKVGRSVVVVVPHLRSAYALVRNIAMLLGKYTLGSAVHYTEGSLLRSGLECGLSLEETYIYSRPPLTPDTLRQRVGQAAWILDSMGEKLFPFPWGELLCARFEKLPSTPD